MMETRSLEQFGLPTYFARNDGQILSTRSRGSNKTGLKLSAAHVIKGGIGSHGYRTVLLRHPDGKQRSRLVHELVGLAFLGAVPSWHEEFRHLDNDKMNCRASNLSFGTRKQNASDRRGAGTWRNGPNSNIKITASIFEEIRQALKNKIPGRDIAGTLGVSESVISNIKNMKARFADWPTERKLQNG